MSSQDGDDLDAVEIASLVRSGDADPVALVERAYERIAALDPALGAIVSLDRETALRDAATVSRDLPLAGVPILIKDTNLDVAGYPTRHGSRFYAHAAPATEDSEFVRRLRRAGMIILGKSKTPEFAGDFVTEPAALGPARNPWDPGRTPGGSSGGAASAVASRMVPVAHGTDCGGSIRVPAACCGIVGLKPSRGRTPSGPAAGERVSGLNAEGVLTRTIRDTAALLDILAQPERGAPYQTLPPETGWLRGLAPTDRHLTIGVVRHRMDGSAPHPSIAAGIDRVKAILEDLGHRIVPFDWPDIADASDGTAIFWQSEIAELIEARRTILGREPDETEIEPCSRHAWNTARSRSVLDYLKAKSVQNRVTRLMAAAFEPIDVLLLPATADLPPAIGGFTPQGADFDYAGWADAAYGFAPFSEIFNITGQPALAIPAALSAEGLPIGVQLVGNFGEDALLLNLAQRLETIIGWPSWRPPMLAA